MTDDRSEAQKVIDACHVVRPIRDMTNELRHVRQSVVDEALHSAEIRIEDLEKENKRLRLMVALDQRIREMEAELAMLKIELKSVEGGERCKGLGTSDGTGFCRTQIAQHPQACCELIDL